MSHRPSTVLTLKATCTGDGTFVFQEHGVSHRTNDYGGNGIEAGGFIDPDDGTTAATIVVSDSLGRTIYSGSVASNTAVTVDANPKGVYGPLQAVITGSNGGLVIYWSIKR